MNTLYKYSTIHPSVCPLPLYSYPSICLLPLYTLSFRVFPPVVFHRIVHPSVYPLPLYSPSFPPCVLSHCIVHSSVCPFPVYSYPSVYSLSLHRSSPRVFFSTIVVPFMYLLLVVPFIPPYIFFHISCYHPFYTLFFPVSHLTLSLTIFLG